MAFEHYLQRGLRRLRCGYTTGTCAALAAQAAASMLLGQRPVTRASLVTPKGLKVEAAVEEAAFGPDFARAGVRKDGGDDVDATHGLLILARVVPHPLPGIRVEGGEGVGRITLPGLDGPVGSAAINPVPRRMIVRQVEEARRRYGYDGGLSVVVEVPGGREAARSTFNARLGIEGGISILGSSGIVEPQSLQALVDTIEAELRVQAALGHRRLILTPGNYGETFLAAHPPADSRPVVKCSNFIGEALELAAALGFEDICLIGHAGKLVKLAAGIMNTHSRFADGRREVFAAHAALAGAGRETVAALMDAPTSDACVALLDAAGLRRAVMDSILAAAAGHLRRRAGPGVSAGLLLFSNQYGPLAWTVGAGRLLGLTKGE